MFIPTIYTGKGKFIAFLPETISAGQMWSNKLQGPKRTPNFITVAAYWHEIKNGKKIACYGYIQSWLNKTDLPDGVDDLDFSFGAFLEDAYARDIEDSEMSVSSGISFTGLYKLGHSRPWSTPYYPSPYFNAQNHYDPQVLANMITNPAQVPDGAVGWFKIASKKK